MTDRPPSSMQLSLCAPSRKSPLAAWLLWLEQLHPTEMELGLARVSEVAIRAGLTQELPTVLRCGLSHRQLYLAAYHPF